MYSNPLNETKSTVLEPNNATSSVLNIDAGNVSAANVWF